MSRGTVLIGFAEALSAPEVTWSLVNRGYTVHAFTRKGRRAALRHSKHVRCHDIAAPEVDAEKAVSDLRSLLRQLKTGNDELPLVLFPLDDNAVWVCDQVAGEEGSILAGPVGTATDAALNKDRQMALAKECGLNVPVTRIIENAAQFEDLDLEFPLMLRPARAVFKDGSRLRKLRKWICLTQGELDSAIQEWAGEVPLVVQPFVLGNGEGVFGLAAPDEMRAWSAHRRVRMMNPHGSGSSACASRSVGEDLKAPIERFLRESGWKGLFMIELLRDEDGKVWFIEFNGRPWGSMALARSQGFEYPAWHIDLTLDSGSDAGKGAGHPAERVCRHVGREFMHLLFVLRGPKSKALVRWPSFWKTLGSLARVSRRDRVYNWRANDIMVFFSDICFTIHDQIFKPRR